MTRTPAEIEEEVYCLERVWAKTRGVGELARFCSITLLAFVEHGTRQGTAYTRAELLREPAVRGLLKNNSDKVPSRAYFDRLLTSLVKDGILAMEGGYRGRITSRLRETKTKAELLGFLERAGIWALSWQMREKT